MSYLEHFGLAREPFSNAPVTDGYYASNQHGHALERLKYTVEQSKGLALLMGAIGAGKSTLARRLLETLPSERFEASLFIVVHDELPPGWLLGRIAAALGVGEPSTDRLVLLSQLFARLEAIHSSGRRAVVLIDEAQMLRTRSVMEELRGLLNLELPGTKLLTIVLFGLGELEEQVKLDPPLAQRVALKIRLGPLSVEATEAYVKHRLRVAGARRMPFSIEAVRALHRYTAGTPRLINTLCDNALYEAAAAGQQLATAALVARCAGELGLAEEMPQTPFAAAATRTPVPAPTAAPAEPEAALPAAPRKA